MTMDRIKEDLGLQRTTLSAQVVDSARGGPAAGMAVTVTRPDGSTISGRTDAEGRARVPDNVPAGAYTITFATGPWFAAQRLETWHPTIDIHLTVSAGQDHHVVVLVGPFGYTTYRGA